MNVSAPKSVVFWFTRHGESTGAQEGCYGGAADFPLSERGRCQAAALREQAVRLGLNLVLSSPLLRAKQTAEIVVAGRRDCDMVILDDLQERNSYGVLSGLKPHEAAELFPDIMFKVDGRPEVSGEDFPSAESIQSFQLRVSRAFSRTLRIVADAPSQRTLMILHGKFLQELLEVVLGASGDVSYKPGALHELQYRPTKCRVVRITRSRTTKAESEDVPMKIYMLRHGEAQDDIDDAYGGVADHPLTPRGEEQAREVALSLEAQDITRIYTSPLRRAATTASIVAEVLGVSDNVRIVDDLRERNSYGVLSGIPKTKAWELFPLILKPGETRSGYDKTPLLGAEDFDDFLARVGSAFTAVLDEAAKDDVRSIALVSHGTFLKALVTEYLGLSLPDGWGHATPLLLEYEPAVASVRPV
jgi:2,3-bisphosphoglycerate-dependent phosphoglycerate mutase